MTRIKALAAMGVAATLFTACGGQAPDSQATDTIVAAQEAPPAKAPPEPAPPPPISDDRPAGLPMEAIRIENGDHGVFWAVKREGNKALLYSDMGNGSLMGTAGTISELSDIYPDADFTPLMDTPPDDAASEGDDTPDGIDGVIKARDRLVEVTPGAKEAIERSKNGDYLDLTGGTLTHMIESMGGKLDFSPEELDAMLQQTDGRFTVTNSEMNWLLKEAGPDGITREQIAALLPRTEEAKPLGPPEKGREEEGCPGLVYGNGGRKVCLPLGLLSFADAVVDFVPGEKPSRAPFDYPPSALGEPNYRNTSSADFISIGCNGILSLQFTDNILVDVEGIDLYIFEVGPFVERTELAISQDGTNWIDVGVIEGSRADVDIAPFVQKGDKFPFVRLTNASDSCGGYHSGADIDAVAAVGAEIRLSLDSALLFDVGKSDIKPEAAEALAALASQVEAYGPDIRVTVEGHTDATGSTSDNQKLSEDRAHSVWTYLAGLMGTVPKDVTIKG